MIHPPRLFAEVCGATLLAIALGYGAGWGLAAMLGGQAPHYAGVGCGCYCGVLMLTVGMALYMRVIEVDTKAWHAPRQVEGPKRFELVTGHVTTIARLDVTDAQLDALRRGLAVDRSLSARRWVGKGKAFREYNDWRVVVDELVKRGWASRVGQSWAINDAGLRGISPTPERING